MWQVTPHLGLVNHWARPQAAEDYLELSLEDFLFFGQGRYTIKI